MMGSTRAVIVIMMHMLCSNMYIVIIVVNCALFQLFPYQLGRCSRTGWLERYIGMRGILAQVLASVVLVLHCNVLVALLFGDLHVVLEEHLDLLVAVGIIGA